MIYFLAEKHCKIRGNGIECTNETVFLNSCFCHAFCFRRYHFAGHWINLGIDTMYRLRIKRDNRKLTFYLLWRTLPTLGLLDLGFSFSLLGEDLRSTTLFLLVFGLSFCKPGVCVIWASLLESLNSLVERSRLLLGLALLLLRKQYYTKIRNVW